MPTCPRLEELPPLSTTALPEQVEVGILGAGLPAVMLAVQLRARGVLTALLPNQDISGEPSLLGLGLLRQLPWQDYDLASKTYGRDFARSVLLLGQKSLQGLNDKVVGLPHDVGWFRTGSLSLGSQSDARMLERNAARLNGDGCRAQHWDADQLQKRMGQSSLEHALFIADDAMVEPGFLWYALLEEYLASGGLVGEGHWRSAAPELGFCSLAGRRLRCDNCVDASAGPIPGLPGGVRLRLVQTERVHKMYPMGMHLLPFGLSCRQGGRGEVLICGADCADKDTAFLSSMAGCLPRMQGVTSEASWSALQSLAPDALPLVGSKADLTGHWHLQGFGEANLGLAWGLCSTMAEGLAAKAWNVTLCDPSRVTLQSHMES